MGLDGVELIMAYEEVFGIQFTDEDAVRMRTPRDVIDFIASRVPITSESTFPPATRLLGERGEPWSRQEIAQTVKQITLAQLGDVPYGEDQRFVEDLGVD